MLIAARAVLAAGALAGVLLAAPAAAPGAAYLPPGKKVFWGGQGGLPALAVPAALGPAAASGNGSAGGGSGAPGVSSPAVRADEMVGGAVGRPGRADGAGLAGAARRRQCRGGFRFCGRPRVRDRATVLRVRIPRRGVLILLGGRALERGKRAALVRRLRRPVRRAGLVRLVVRPTRAGRQALATQGRLGVRVRVVYRPAGGRQRVRRRRVALRTRSKVVRAQKRPATVLAQPRQTRSVSGTPSGRQRVILTRGASVPKVGRALVLPVSRAAPRGLLGVVIRVRRAPGGRVVVWTKPGTLDDAYSNFRVSLDGTLEELGARIGGGQAGAAGRPRARPAAGGLGALFRCKGGAKPAVKTEIDLFGKVSVHGQLDARPADPYLAFQLVGRPELSIDYRFAGAANCTARTRPIVIPIGSTPLVVTLRPKFTVSASGQFTVGYQWRPFFNVEFARGRGLDRNVRQFQSHGTPTATGRAGFDAFLGLDAQLTLGGRVGVGGEIGPQLTGSASARTTASGTEACLDLNAALRLALTANADVFVKRWTFTLYSGTFLNRQIYHRCTPSGGAAPTPDDGTDDEADGGSPEGSGPGGLTEAVAVTAGGAHSCALLPAGKIECWGWNGYGQLGDGTTIDSTTPVSAAGITDAVGVAAGFQGHSCVLLADGDVQCWGNNGSGQLGTGSFGGPESCDALNDDEDCSSTPVAVSRIVEAVGVVAGGDHSCALLADGGVKCWGNNWAGQLGDGTTTNSAVPVSVVGIADAISVAAGGNNTCALLADGRVECWGNNWLGQLGDGSTANSSIAVPVSGIIDATVVAVGGGHSCALLASSSVECWGSNGAGQLGTGSADGPETCEGGRACSTSSVAVSGIGDATTIAAGGAHSCAVITDGGIECWGANWVGQLGGGESCAVDVSCGPAPVSVTGIADATAVAASGGDHSCALLANGDIECWGDNWAGQLGDGTTSNSTSPVRVTEIP